MTRMIFIKEVNLAFGHKKIFNHISESIGARDRIALVGSNGSGKTTLLRMLMGEVEPDEGEIQKPDYATVGYLPQDGISVARATASERGSFIGFCWRCGFKDKPWRRLRPVLGKWTQTPRSFMTLIDQMGAWEEQAGFF